MKKILIAEDEKEIIGLLSLYLESEGFTVISAEDGEKAQELFKSEHPDLLIADIMMPKKNGYDLIREIRKTSQIPIIVLSAKNLGNDKVLGLNIGADVYITKPFDPLEVVAYVKASLRRQSYKTAEKGKNTVIDCGRLCLDTEKLVLTKDGEAVNLTSTELKILMILMKHPQRVYTKNQLYQQINGDYYESDDNTMMVHISNLRCKIEDDPVKPVYIKTVRGLGYKFEFEKNI